VKRADKYRRPRPSGLGKKISIERISSFVPLGSETMRNVQFHLQPTWDIVSVGYKNWNDEK